MNKQSKEKVELYKRCLALSEFVSKSENLSSDVAAKIIDVALVEPLCYGYRVTKQ